jgi:membrane-bound lytic murein transglycosylase
MTRTRVIAACALLAPALLAGCASKPPRPEAQLARAEASLVQAEQSGARQYSGMEYDTARDKLGEAKRLADQGKTAPAALLADQARADAEFAAARSRHLAADKAANEVRMGTEALQDETTRQQAPAPATP